jgi:4,5-dihydroxyphthalate decarboxylase
MDHLGRALPVSEAQAARNCTHLKIAIAEHPHTSAIRNGSIPIEGVDAEFVTVKPQIGAFRRMVRSVEFDVCELAPTTYIIARAYGAPFIALPIFVVRRFHHAACWCARMLASSSRKNWRASRFGVRAYSVTTGVWARRDSGEATGQLKATIIYPLFVNT